MTGVAGSSAVRHIRHRLEFFICDGDDFGSVLRDRAACRHNGRQRFTLPADPVDGDGVLRCGFEALQMRQHADPRRNDRRQFPPCDNGDDPGHAFTRIGIDPDDFRMRVRRAQKNHMRHPRQHHVADIKPAALHQPFEIRPRHGLADVGVGPIQHRKAIGICRACGHGVRPIRARAVVSMASMMA